MGVSVAERVAQRDRDRDDVAVGQPAGLQQRRQRLATDQFGDEVGAVVVDRRLVQGDDPGMREPRGSTRLALEPATDDPLARKDLDRDVAVESLVVAIQTVPKPPAPSRRWSR